MNRIMQPHYLKKLLVLLGSFACSFMVALPSVADDTDIYFASNDGNNDYQPNVLFLLDNSISMSWSISGGREGVYTVDDPQRMATLKTAFNELIDQVSGINIGLMTFDESGFDGDLNFPIAPIDNLIEAGSDGETHVRRGLTANEDDTQLERAATRNHALTEGTLGLRFRNIDIPPNATITSASLILHSMNNNGNSQVDMTTTIYGHKASNADSSISDILFQPTKTTKKADFSLTGSWPHRTPLPLTSPDLADVIEEIVSVGGWVSGNSLVLLLTNDGSAVATSRNGERRIASREREQALSAAIEISYSVDNGNGTQIRVRDEVKNRVSALTPTVPRTPSVAQLYKAYEHIASDGFPIAHQCQRSHIIMLSDGEPSYISGSTSIDTLTGKTCSAPTSCGTNLTEWMNTHHVKNGTLSSPNHTVQTQTIGFATSETAENFLRSLAENGGGNFSSAQSSDDLVATLQRNLNNILDTDSTLVTPSVTVNQFNRLEHRNQIYYALFKPSTTYNWQGNVKRYQLVLDPSDNAIKLGDSDNELAVNETNGQFKVGAKSFWLPAEAPADGHKTSEGGVAVNLPSSRNIYTDLVADSSSLTATGNLVHEDNDAITATMLGADSPAERNAILQWARGYIDIDYRRQAIGDPLHSRPVLISYGCDSDGYVTTDVPSSGCRTEEDAMLFFGTNQGYFHGVSTGTGVEQFAYIPKDLLLNLKLYQENTAIPNNDRNYGLDGSPTVWSVDLNNNGVIEPGTTTVAGDKVYAYIGMRRGGKNLYALDVTNRTAVKKLWEIKGGVAGTPFVDLGQTWSKPVKTKIRLGTGANNLRDVLVFGGGYDSAQDDATNITEDSTGNAIFIVDAVTGSLLWSAGKGTDHDLALSGMKYSIPSNVTVLDSDLDGVMDQLFVGDMGGQVWRIFFNGTNTGAANLASAGGTGDNKGVFANLSGTNAAGARRFYHNPSVALIEENYNLALAVSIGSGFRANPLEKVNANRFYVLKTLAVNSYSDSDTPLTEASLHNATPDVVSDTGTTSTELQTELGLLTIGGSRDDAGNITDTSGGWYIVMNTTRGEKVLSSATTFENTVFFTTYIPETTQGSCSPVRGVNTLYGVSVTDASGQLENGARSSSLNNSGIIDGAATLFLNDIPIVGGGTTGERRAISIYGTETYTHGSGGGQLPTYWSDERVKAKVSVSGGGTTTGGTTTGGTTTGGTTTGGTTTGGTTTGGE